MEQKETLGKRIAALRKAHGWTQEQLAEKIGISAQAVSKWENDISCPDVMTLPLLAKLFGVSVDGLLGVSAAEPQVVVVNPEKSEDKKERASWSWEWQGMKHSGVTLSVTAILIGLTLLIRELRPGLFPANETVWNLIWPLILVWPGLSGLINNRRPFGVAGGLVLILYGAYQFIFTLLGRPEGWPVIGWYAILLALAVLFLICKLFKKPSAKHEREGRSPTMEHAETETDFDLDASFGGETVRCTSQSLSRAKIETSFGDYTVDFTQAHFNENALIETETSFGQLTLIFPTDVIVRVDREASFGSVSTHGDLPAAGVKVFVKSEVSFGNVDVRYFNAV